MFQFFLRKHSYIMEFCICLVLLLSFTSFNIYYTYVGSSFLSSISSHFSLEFFLSLSFPFFLSLSFSFSSFVNYISQFLFPTMVDQLVSEQCDGIWRILTQAMRIYGNLLQKIRESENSSWIDENLSKTFHRFKGLEEN